MVIEKASNISKVWFKFSKTLKSGKNLVFSWEPLPENRVEELLDFKMKYYVKHEITHIAAGIYKNPKAIEEYREILSKKFREPTYCNAICCIDDENKDLVACNSLNLYRRGEKYEYNVQPVTPEVKRFYEILERWDEAFSIPDVLTKYNVDMIMDDDGAAVRPDFWGYGFTYKINLLRHTIAKANGVPMTGAWMTSGAVQRSSKLDGWEIVYEASTEKMESILEIKFQNPPPVIVYKIKKSD